MHPPDGGDPADFIRQSFLGSGATVVANARISIAGRGNWGDIELLMMPDAPFMGRETSWSARWIVPNTEDAAQLINGLLTDDAACALTLSDGRSSPFTYTYDGLTVGLIGLGPLK